MIILLDRIIFTICLQFIDYLKRECNLVLIIKLNLTLTTLKGTKFYKKKEGTKNECLKALIFKCLP